MINLNILSQEAYRISRKREQHGAVKIKDILKHCAGEVVEAAEARAAWESVEYFDGLDKESYSEELADVIICVMIAAARDGIDLESAINHKMIVNLQRAQMEGDKL